MVFNLCELVFILQVNLYKTVSHTFGYTKTQVCNLVHNLHNRTLCLLRKIQNITLELYY